MKMLLTTVFVIGLMPYMKAQSNSNMKTQQNAAAITEVLQQKYLKGIYTGDTSLLSQAFSITAILSGDVKGQPYSKTVEQYLEGVAGRVSPQNSGKPFTAEILSVDVMNTTAMAKLHVKMYDFNYYNFLTFQQINNQWLIVYKTLTHVEE